MTSSAASPASGPPETTVSLILTILNEASQLPELLTSIKEQTRQPDEVIVVDGGSTDGSLEILERWGDRLPLRVLSHPSANISQGRNIGISHASSNIIAVTDAGVRLDSEWLEHLVGPFEQGNHQIDVVSGFFEPDCRNAFEIALAASTLPDVEEIEPESFLPSSRSLAFRRDVFSSNVRYPEWLDYCEDLVFDLTAKAAGHTFMFQQCAIVYFRPRSNLKSFLVQYYRYARGDGKSGLFLKRHLIRYGVYLLGVPSFFVIRSWWWRILIISGASAYMRQPFRRLRRRTDWRGTKFAKHLVVSGALRALGDIAKMIGYPVGLWWRARRYGLHQDWRTIRD